MNAIAQRLFFALRPPEGAIGDLAAIRDGHAGGTALRDDLLHVTLLLLPDYAALPAGLVAAMQAVGAGIRIAPLRVAFNELIGAPGTLLLRPDDPLPHLERFQAALRSATIAAGVAIRPGWRFDPHVTLRRGKTEPCRRSAGPVSWRVEDFALLLSHVGETRHEELGRWRLS